MTKQIEKTAFDFGSIAANAKDATSAAIHETATMVQKAGDNLDSRKIIQTDYKAGYVKTYLDNRGTKTDREMAYLILRKAGDKAANPNEFGQRTELEQKAERAADASWTVVKRHANVTKNAAKVEASTKKTDKAEKTEKEIPEFVPAKNSAELFQRIEMLMAMMRQECDSARNVKDDPAMKLRVMVSNWNGDLKSFGKSAK